MTTLSAFLCLAFLALPAAAATTAPVGTRTAAPAWAGQLKAVGLWAASPSGISELGRNSPWQALAQADFRYPPVADLGGPLAKALPRSAIANFTAAKADRALAKASPAAAAAAGAFETVSPITPGMDRKNFDAAAEAIDAEEKSLRILGKLYKGAVDRRVKKRIKDIGAIHSAMVMEAAARIGRALSESLGAKMASMEEARAVPAKPRVGTQAAAASKILKTYRKYDPNAKVSIQGKEIIIQTDWKGLLHAEIEEGWGLETNWDSNSYLKGNFNGWQVRFLSREVPEEYRENIKGLITNVEQLPAKGLAQWLLKRGFVQAEDESFKRDKLYLLKKSKNGSTAQYVQLYANGQIEMCTLKGDEHFTQKLDADRDVFESDKSGPRAGF